MKPEPGDDQSQTARAVSELLAAWSRGDQTALGQLIPLVDAELRRLASHYLSQQKHDHTLQTTALINEAYIRLMEGARNVSWQGRGHFVGIAATLMRQILVDHARKRGSRKRGGELVRVTFERALEIAEASNEDLIAIDEAVKALEAEDGRAAKVVVLRFFGGLSVEETADALNISTDTVGRDWKFAKVWLLDRLNG